MTTVNTQGFGVQLAPAGFSLEANKIFESYEAALTFVRTKPAAYVGSVITVKAPSTIDGVTYPSGVYNVTAVGENGALEQVGKDTDLSGYYNKTDVDEIADELATAVRNKADKTALNALTSTVEGKADQSDVELLATNVLAKNEAAAIDVRLYYPELLSISQTAFLVDYEIYSESLSSLIVSKTEVLDSNANVIATVRDGQLVSVAEATYTTRLFGRHDFTFRVTLESGLVHKHKFSINYHSDMLSIGSSDGLSTFDAYRAIVLSKCGKYETIFIGNLEHTGLAESRGGHVAVRTSGLIFYALKSNGFVIPMEYRRIDGFDTYVSTAPIADGVIENIELVYCI